MILGKLIFNLDHNRLIKQSKLRIGLAFGWCIYLICIIQMSPDGEPLKPAGGR